MDCSRGGEPWKQLVHSPYESSPPGGHPWHIFIAGAPRPHNGLHWGEWTHSSSTPTPYLHRSPPPPPPPTQGFLSVEWVLPEGGGQPVRLPTSTGLAALGLSDYSLHAFTSALQGVVADGVSTEVPPPSRLPRQESSQHFPSCTYVLHVVWQWMGNFLPFGRRLPKENGGSRG